MEEKKIVGKRDMYLSAAFIAEGVPYIKAELDFREGKKIYTFFFEESPEIERIENQAVNGTLVVSYRMFVDAIRTLKSVIHS